MLQASDSKSLPFSPLNRQFRLSSSVQVIFCAYFPYLLSNIVQISESNSSTDRRQQTVVFTLTNDQLAKLKSARYVRRHTLGPSRLIDHRTVRNISCAYSALPLHSTPQIPHSALPLALLLSNSPPPVKSVSTTCSYL